MIDAKLKEIYKHVDELRELILPYDKALMVAGYKSVKNQSISEQVKSARLINSILEVDSE